MSEEEEQLPFESIIIALDSGHAVVVEEPSDRISFELYAADWTRINPQAVYIAANSEGANWSEGSLKADIEAALAE